MLDQPRSPRTLRSANADWVRALQKTAGITPDTATTIGLVVAERALAGDPAHVAFVEDEGAWTYDGFARQANRYSRWALAQGFARGDCVALVMSNCADYAAFWIGLTRIGVVVALINTQLRGTGLGHCLTLADPRCVVVDTEHAEPVTEVCQEGVPVWVRGTMPDRRSLDIASFSGSPLAEHEQPELRLSAAALLIYTSGTTGLPKAARVSHYRIMMWSAWFAGVMDAKPDDRLYNCLPMYHSIGGVVAIGAMLVAGGSIVVRRTFSASRFWPDVAATGATIFQYIGELCRFLVNAPDHAEQTSHHLRLCCGNGLRADVWEGFVRRFAIPQVIEFYAATEGSFSLFNLEGKPGAIGRIPRFMAHRSPVAIVAFDLETEQAVRGDDGFCVPCAVGETGEAIGRVASQGADLATRFEGYTSDAETERKVLRDVFAKGDMWFRTGDLMKRDREGFYYFVDRIGDTFRWKGENVATGEVADALGGAPGVLEANVYGVAVPGTEGRAGMACLVVAEGFDIEAFGRHVETSLPFYARPVFVRIMPRIETTSTFKMKKADLVRDGFDPSGTVDALFVATERRYRLLDAAVYADILAGAVRL